MINSLINSSLCEHLSSMAQFNDIVCDSEKIIHVPSKPSAIVGMVTNFVSIETKFVSIETKIVSIETKIVSIETKFVSIETKFDTIETNRHHGEGVMSSHSQADLCERKMSRIPRVVQQPRFVSLLHLSSDIRTMQNYDKKAIQDDDMTGRNMPLTRSRSKIFLIRYLLH